MKRKTAQALRYPAFIAAGFIGGVLLLAAAFCEAGGGHGSYYLFGVASCPGLVLPHVFFEEISDIGAFFMLISPVVQWTFIGVALAEVVVRKRARWSYAIMAIGVTSIAAALFGFQELCEGLTESEAMGVTIIGIAKPIIRPKYRSPISLML